MVDTPPQTDTYNTALDIFDRTHPLRVDANENLKVTGTFIPSGTQDVRIVADTDDLAKNSQLQTLNSLVPSVYDYIALSYTGTNLTQVVYKIGGSGGTVVSTLTLAYTGSNLTSVTKT